MDPFSLIALVAQATPTVPDVAAVATETSALPTWATVLLTIITIVVTAVAAMLRKKYKTESEHLQIDTSKTLMEQKNFIIDRRLIPFLINTGEHWVLTQMPALVTDAADGGGFEWKAHWKNLVKYMKEEAVQKFAEENVDIITLFGEDYIDKLINRLAMKLISKLPENLQALLPKSVVDMATKAAASFAIDKGQDLLGVKIE